MCFGSSNLPDLKQDLQFREISKGGSLTADRFRVIDLPGKLDLLAWSCGCERNNVCLSLNEGNVFLDKGRG